MDRCPHCFRVVSAREDRRRYVIRKPWDGRGDSAPQSIAATHPLCAISYELYFETRAEAELELLKQAI